MSEEGTGEGSTSSLDPNLPLAYLERMGIAVWRPRVAVPFGPELGTVAMAETDGKDIDSPAPVLNPPPTSPGWPEPAAIPEDHAPPKPPLPTWDELEARVAVCTACPLHQGRTQTVFGVGNRQAEWMFVGEAPGEQEDLQGEPFVGRAGQLLNEMIRAIGLRREDVFIANVLKCRPPKNRDPQPDEAAACEGYLKAQLGLVKPRIIVALGRIAAQNLLKTATPIGKLRGQVLDYENIPLVVTYHPAYLLRSQTEKRRAWDDLKLALRTSRRCAQEEQTGPRES